MPLVDGERNVESLEKIAKDTQIAMCPIGQGEKQRYEILAPCHVFMPLPDCQAVCIVSDEFLSGQFLIGKFRTQTAHVTQSTRPNQGARTLGGLIVFLRKTANLSERIPLFGQFSR